jgi:hypothetical protein
MKISCKSQFAYLVCVIILLGCSQANILQKFASPEDQTIAKNYIDLLRHQQFGDIEKAIDPSISAPSLHNTLVKMGALFPLQEPASVTLVGVRSMHMSGADTKNITFEYAFSGKWLLVNVAVKKQDGVSTIVGFNVIPQPASLETQNRFTLSDKSWVQHLILIAVVIVPLLTLYALVLCVMTKIKGRKWPWILFILFGIGRIAVNWTTGQFTFTLLSVQLLGASAFAPLYEPWTLAVSLPLGAIFFLLLRRKLMKQEVGDGIGN